MTIHSASRKLPATRVASEDRPARASRPIETGEATALLDYKGTGRWSIQGTALNDALDEQQRVIFDVRTLLEIAATSLCWFESASATSRPMPEYSRLFRNAAKALDDAAIALDAGELEDRALAIARAREAQAAAS